MHALSSLGSNQNELRPKWFRIPRRPDGDFHYSLPRYLEHSQMVAEPYERCPLDNGSDYNQPRLW